MRDRFVMVSLSGPQDGEPTQGTFVEVLADGVVEHGHVGEADEFRDADADGETAHGLAGTPRRRMPLMVGMRGSSQPVTTLSFTSWMSLRLETMVVTRDQLGEFVLVWQRTRQVEISRIQS